MAPMCDVHGCERSADVKIGETSLCWLHALAQKNAEVLTAAKLQAEDFVLWEAGE